MRASVLMQRANDRVHNPLPDATKDLEGYNDKAARVQAAYKNGGFYGLFNVHGRDYKGSATTFRANIIKRGTNDLVDGFDASVYPTDGYNTQTLDSPAVSAPACAGTWTASRCTRSPATTPPSSTAVRTWMAASAAASVASPMARSSLASPR